MRIDDLIIEDQVFRDHAGAERVDVAGLAEQFPLLDVARHLR